MMETQTQASTSLYRYPYIYRGLHAGYYYGYGWYPIVGGVWNWPGYSPGWHPYGYTYYPYYNYQPYYSTFGAIAYSPSTGQYGFSYRAVNQSQAVQAAINYCGANDCSSVVWVQGGCAAAAVGKATEDGDNNISWAYDTSRIRARNMALQACRNAGNAQCDLLAWTCSY